MKKGMISILSAMVGAVGGAAVGAGIAANIAGESEERNRKLSDKHLALFLMMNQWVKIKQEGKNIALYLEEKGYKKIAIYGMSYAGETLIAELKDTSIEIAYGIDKNAESIYADIDVVSGDTILEEVDAIVVTAITFYDEIEETLKAKVNCPILSLEDILYEI